MKNSLTNYSFYLLITIAVLFTSCTNGKITYGEVSSLQPKAILTNKSKSKRIEFTVKEYTTVVISTWDSYDDDFKHVETKKSEKQYLIKLNPGESTEVERWWKTERGGFWKIDKTFKVVGELEIE